MDSASFAAHWNLTPKGRDELAAKRNAEFRAQLLPSLQQAFGGMASAMSDDDLLSLFVRFVEEMDPVAGPKD